ncbi:MAG: DinB family protein [Candidatus Saccharibacteria bacterium]
MENEDMVRSELAAYLGAAWAHASLIEAARVVTLKFINYRPENLPYTLWALLEHIRLTQRDMLDFILDPDYQERDWPGDYWPDPELKATSAMWKETLKYYREDAETLRAIVKDKGIGLTEAIAWGEGQTVLREVLQIIDHTGYHTGEFILMMQLAGVWKG